VITESSLPIPVLLPISGSKRDADFPVFGNAGSGMFGKICRVQIRLNKDEESG
jgi:hypothetical protein